MSEEADGDAELVEPGTVDGVVELVVEEVDGTEEGETVVVELGTVNAVLEPVVVADAGTEPTG